MPRLRLERTGRLRKIQEDAKKKEGRTYVINVYVNADMFRRVRSCGAEDLTKRDHDDFAALLDLANAQQPQ